VAPPRPPPPARPRRRRARAQAGSDSLLTAATFLKLSQACFSGFDGMAAHRGVLYGLGSDGNNEARAPPAAGPMPGLHVWVGERVVVAVAAPGGGGPARCGPAGPPVRSRHPRRAPLQGGAWSSCARACGR